MHGGCALLTREHVPQHGEAAPAAFVEKGQCQGCGSHLLPQRPLGHFLWENVVYMACAGPLCMHVCECVCSSACDLPLILEEIA